MEDEERHVQSVPHQHLDRDPSRLTTFPMPGFLASTFQASNDDAENGDDAQTVAGILQSIQFVIIIMTNL
ncbi:unnamed protein product [Peronospora effusa]|nr:unnamed protein product [Peronospora effusa]